MIQATLNRKDSFIRELVVANFSHINAQILQQLNDHALLMQESTIASLFEANSARFDQCHIATKDFLFDYSKQHLTHQVIDSLLMLAKDAGLSEWTSKLFSGDLVNNTEQRAAMHWALRVPLEQNNGEPCQSVNTSVHQQINCMARLADQLNHGQFRGVTGEPITDVVNIGVGGSDLGPLMVSYALDEYRLKNKQSVKVHFASSMDGSQLAQLLTKLRPESTLFVISSKSFTTVDTLYNAETAKAWLSRELGQHPKIMYCHFIGVSTNKEKMTAWGIAPEHQLQMWDWVGGRFSLWSAIGFPIALTIGVEGFRQLLAGAYMMDQHFRQAEWRYNLPVMMALIGVWNTNFLKIKTHAVLPYDGRLKYLASYLQQLEMESNGKSVSRDGRAVDYGTCPVIWGEVGPNAQHAFYQLLHQGTETVACDFIAPVLRYHEVSSDKQKTLLAQHELALANCLAQSRLLALGNAALDNMTSRSVFQSYRGNQPNSTLLLSELSPYHLGALLAAYEHKVFVQSVIWQLNPFDQWGVEMGKKIAEQMLPAIQESDLDKTDSFDASTNGLLKFIQQH